MQSIDSDQKSVIQTLSEYASVFQQKYRAQQYDDLDSTRSEILTLSPAESLDLAYGTTMFARQGGGMYSEPARQAMQMKNQVDADVQYCEGYIQYMENVQKVLTRHARILLDGYIAEITISPEILPDEKRSYCGVQFSLAEAAEIAEMHG